MHLYLILAYVSALVWSVFLILTCLGLSAVFAYLSRGQVWKAIGGAALTLPVAFVAGSAHMAVRLLT